jgi:outer membrane receptor for ferrienterochelin and colicin
VSYFDLNQPDQSATGGELQYLFRTDDFNLTAGGGYFDVNDGVDQLVTLGPPIIPGPPFTPPTLDVPGSTDLDLQHGNVYAYGNIEFAENVTVTIGASYDDADSEYLGENKQQFNPKFGLTWNPQPQTTVRAAAFKSLKRTLITQQTLEPTQVAGFNQFFDDPDLTEAERYGAAIDQKFSKRLFGGVEYSVRELGVPFLNFQTDPQSPPTEESQWDEELGRAYLYWAPTDQLALRAEYQYERLKREEPFVEGVVSSDTHKFPLGVSYFHPTGVSAFMTATYYNQEGEFGGFWATDPIEAGEDDFWTVDVALNYRLPKRYGIVTLGATNLFDEDFRFYDSDLNNASVQPTRTIFAQLSLALP